MHEHAADHLSRTSWRATRWRMYVGVLGARLREPHDGVHTNLDSLQQLCEDAPHAQAA
jgi:hypothetical protein